MTGQNADLSIVGNLAKIVNIEPDYYRFEARFLDGRIGKFTGTNELNLSVGDVIIVGDRAVEIVAPDLWRESNNVSVVLRALEGSAVVEVGTMTKIVDVAPGVNVAVGNTVEYNDYEGILRVLSDTPVRSGGHELDLEEVRTQYLVRNDGEDLSFDDFGGYEDVKARALELIDTQLERRELFDKIGARPVRGILFSGLPGTGKTYLAKVIAQRAKADFYLVSGPEIVSKWVGDTEDTLRKIFKAAENSESGSAIIFFDEIDSIAERRSGNSHESSRRLVGQLLTQMDGFGESGKNIIVIAATNRADSLDPALTRPGRFDWEIEFDLPTLADRLSILKVHARKRDALTDLPLEDLAVLTAGWSAAELTAIWTEAGLLAAGDNRSILSGEDLAGAYERVAAKPRHAVSEEATR